MSFLFSVYVSFVLGALYAIHAFFLNRGSRIHAIPTVGGTSFPLLSYIYAARSLTKTVDIIQEGYTKYKGRCFKYAEQGHWCVVVTSPAAVDELAKAPENVLSFIAAKTDSLQIPYTLGPDIAHNFYHIPLIRTRLMRNAARMFDDIRDEVVSAFSDHWQVQSAKGEHEWVSVGATDLALEVICRATNRVFVGLPICRNTDYLAVQKGFTMNVVLAAAFIKVFPEFMKPCVAQLCSYIPGSIDRVTRHLKPTITERLRNAELSTADEHHPGKDSPNDLLQWLIETAPQGHERTVPALVLRILVVNFAALHTTSTMLTHTLYYLAAHPEHAAALREEVERVVRADGWSKASLGNMRLIDGFLKEVCRVTGLSASSLTRKAVQDYTFADGTYIPKGTIVAAASRDLQLEADHYVDPAVFDPRRYEGQGGSSKDDSARTDEHYLVFGHGQHTCPGRFFAVTELKVILAHIVVTYDVQLPGGSRSIPQPMWLGVSLIPNRKANVLFRKRDVCE
ncbi:hypothetical protein FOMPIDRAFT_93720 [Fomitopsis schrenkii]|uniref:Cytochrome P450 n=1 Tax=Fomitopsis schrenkii TaxID=2126942 RepID=S8DLA9_FOMSC|nr:hypothetical protein FOMPIDRAFT_93720 [Fomitopsis schrenkii]